MTGTPHEARIVIVGIGGKAQARVVLEKGPVYSKMGLC